MVREMDVMEAILSRRSIRKYRKASIDQPTIKDILKAAMSAPSAGNEQPWHFIIIDDPEILEKVPSFHNHAQMLKDAALAILVCCDKALVRHGEMWIQDCAAATENMLIAINAKGLGAVWLGIYPREERINGMRRLLGIPKEIIPFSLVSIGTPAEEKGKEDRYNESRIHHNKW